MSKRDYYEVLGVSRTCVEADLKVAFRKAAMLHHPDRNPGDAAAEVKFKEVNEAYQCLSDGQKRAAYDRFGHAAFENGGGGGGFGGEGFGSSMSDIFEDLFGGMMGGRARGGGKKAKPRDLAANRQQQQPAAPRPTPYLEISLEDAFSGRQAEIKVPTTIKCEPCEGSGAKPGSKPRQCATCGGQGRVRAQQGFFAIERTCPTCQGRGETIDNPCAACSGAGRVMREKNLSVNIPQGVEDGTRIRLSNEGEAGARGGPPGCSLPGARGRGDAWSSVRSLWNWKSNRAYLARKVMMPRTGS